MLFDISPKVKLTGVLALLSEELVDLVTNLAIGNLDVVLGGAIVGHEGKETIIGNVELSAMLARPCRVMSGLHLRAGTPGDER